MVRGSLLMASLLLGIAGCVGAVQRVDPTGEGGGGGGGNGTDGGGGGGGGALPSQLPHAFDENATYSAPVYVATNGSDVTGDGSLPSPFQSVARALQGAGPGRRVVVTQGTYGPQGTLANLTGSLSSPIKIEGSGSVIFDVGGGTLAFHLQDPRYVVLENFLVRNSSVHGINIDDGGSFETPADSVVLRNVRFEQIGSGGNNDCLKLSGVDHFRIEGGQFTGCNMGEAIDMVGCHDGWITGNVFHDMPGTAVQAKGGSRDVWIHGNRFSDIGTHGVNMGGSSDSAVVRPPGAPSEGLRIRAVANVFERSVLTPVAFLGCSDCLAAHNTVIHPLRWVARILPGYQDTTAIPARDGTFVNNIVYFNVADISAFVNIGPDTMPDTFVFGSNLWFAIDDPGFSGPSYSGIPAEDGSLIQQDPAFEDVASGNYRIQPTSPAIGVARELATAPVFDFDGLPFQAPRSAGAFQP